MPMFIDEAGKGYWAKKPKGKLAKNREEIRKNPGKRLHLQLSDKTGHVIVQPAQGKAARIRREQKQKERLEGRGIVRETQGNPKDNVVVERDANKPQRGRPARIDPEPEKVVVKED